MQISLIMNAIKLINDRYESGMRSTAIRLQIQRLVSSNRFIKYPRGVNMFLKKFRMSKPDTQDLTSLARRRVIAGTLISGISLMLLGSCYMFTETSYNTIQDMAFPNTTEGLKPRLSFFSELNYCKIENCEHISCSFIPKDPGAVASRFMQIDFQEQCNNYYTTVKLSFSNCKFPDSRLKPNWLDSKLSIRELTLDSCSLSEIEDNAFTSNTFVDTSTIILTNNYLISLRKKMFHNLKALERLTIKQKTAIKSAELNSLEEVSDTLTSLQLEEGVINDNKVLQNITGSDTLPNLVELSIRYNSIPEVNAELFQGLPAVKSVYIDNSKVETVSIDTLKPFIHITQFILDNNNINSLPEGLTDPVLGSSKFSLSIHDNPWHCDCSLKWIQDIIISRSIKIPQIPFCKTPQENKDKTFLIADFCSQSNSTTTTRRREQSTVRTTTETTTPQEITVNCANTKRMINHHSREPMSNTLQVRSPFPDFYIKNISETMITLNLPNISGTLIWFSNDTRDSPGCEKIVRTSHVLHNMQSKKAYTICLLGEDKTSISPLNCLPAFAANNLDDESENKPWMRASDKLLVYMFFTMSCVLTFIMGCLMTFLMVRRHPTLLSGSERVMMVKRREVKAIVLPKGVNVSDNKQKLDCDRFYNKSEDGYVTPLPPVDETLPRRVRRVSLQSDKNSYVSQVEATGSQLNSWRVMMERQTFESPPTPPSTDTIPSLSLSVDTENVYQDTN